MPYIVFWKDRESSGQKGKSQDKSETTHRCIKLFSCGRVCRGHCDRQGNADAGLRPPRPDLPSSLLSLFCSFLLPPSKRLRDEKSVEASDATWPSGARCCSLLTAQCGESIEVDLTSTRLTTGRPFNSSGARGGEEGVIQTVNIDGWASGEKQQRWHSGPPGDTQLAMTLTAPFLV